MNNAFRQPALRPGIAGSIARRLNHRGCVPLIIDRNINRPGGHLRPLSTARPGDADCVGPCASGRAEAAARERSAVIADPRGNDRTCSRVPAGARDAVTPAEVCGTDARLWGMGFCFLGGRTLPHP